MSLLLQMQLLQTNQQQIIGHIVMRARIQMQVGLEATNILRNDSATRMKMGMIKEDWKEQLAEAFFDGTTRLLRWFGLK
jgi:hypothetical protein